MHTDRSFTLAEPSHRGEVVRDLCRCCDLAERLQLVPPSAQSRGLYVMGIDRALARAGALDRFKTLFPQRLLALGWYPTSDFLVRLAVGGALLAGPDKVHEGMFEIGQGNAVAFAESLLGRALIRILDRDPKRLLEQALAGRRLGSRFGHWDLELLSDREAVVTMTDEFSYIESYLLGAAKGTFDAIGVPVRAEAVLQNRFNGKHLLSW
ncbi:MAG: TIGR02265 family protein [Polyangiaceae bacterium]